MKEKLLVLAKACPEISSKYEHLVCVAGITDKGEWRRIYPIPWKVFWANSKNNFKKKMWIEYELESDKPSDHRPESRRIKFDTICPIREASFKEIEGILQKHLTSLKELEEKTPRKASLGVIQPNIIDFMPISNAHYEKMIKKSKQQSLFGGSAVKLDIPKFKYQYIFENTKKHEMLCEDWEVAELYRHCEKYRKNGKYKDENEVHSKVKEKMLKGITANGHVYFIVGSHYRFPTYMIIGVIYPRKADLK